MNKDQIKGAAKEAAGEIEQKIREVIGDHRMPAKGAAWPSEGKMQKAGAMRRNKSLATDRFSWY